MQINEVLTHTDNAFQTNNASSGARDASLNRKGIEAAPRDVAARAPDASSGAPDASLNRKGIEAAPAPDASAAAQESTSCGASSEPFVPTIVAFCCNWCSYAGADLAGTNRLQYPAQVKIIRVPCSCRVNPLFVLRAFGRGADGVILCGCHPGDCHYTSGNYFARRRMTLLFSMLDFLGIEKERTRVEWVSAAEGAKFAQTMNDFVKTVTTLGKNKRLEDLRCSKI